MAYITVVANLGYAPSPPILSGSADRLGLSAVLESYLPSMKFVMTVSTQTNTLLKFIFDLSRPHSVGDCFRDITQLFVWVNVVGMKAAEGSFSAEHTPVRPPLIEDFLTGYFPSYSLSLQGCFVPGIVLTPSVVCPRVRPSSFRIFDSHKCVIPILPRVFLVGSETCRLVLLMTHVSGQGRNRTATAIGVWVTTTWAHQCPAYP